MAAERRLAPLEAARYPAFLIESGPLAEAAFLLAELQVPFLIADLEQVEQLDQLGQLEQVRRLEQVRQLEQVRRLQQV